ncbi:hypothetical protein DPMN_160569 [Dreissena polymorpha]|uniref:Uncharacterized protein n=1 Tax=Dreissena polymorpha TaxID=45954 RepID=A0A9D4EMH0_DREPO|nr:hypothetical protein DPMN_160569 [Dreissena polymorpha]
MACLQTLALGPWTYLGVLPIHWNWDAAASIGFSAKSSWSNSLSLRGRPISTSKVSRSRLPDPGQFGPYSGDQHQHLWGVKIYPYKTRRHISATHF